MPLVPSPLHRAMERVTGRSRRVWATEGRAHVEYRAPEPGQAVAYAERLVAALTEMDEVHTATLNPHVARVIVGFDELWVTVEEVVATVEDVEVEFGVAGEPFPADRADHPGDVEPLLRELLQLGSTVLGLGATVVGRLRVRRRRSWPTDLAWVATLADNVPQLRSRVEETLGPRSGDLLLGVTNSLLRGITLGLSGHVVDVAQRATRLRELSSVRAAWREREPALLDVAAAELAGRPERPVPLPEGPVERYGQQAWPASLGGFAASIVATDDVERAAAPLLDGIPKAARLGRGAFFSQLGRVLAERAILVLDREAVGVLDRVDAVVVDGELLRDARSRHRTEEVSRFLRGVLEPGWPVVVTGEVEGLPRRVDVIAPEDADPEVERLQADGHVVLAIGRSGDPAFPRADVRAGLQPAEAPPPWDADVLCTDELADALLLIRAATAARRNSEQAVTLATTGAGIGAVSGMGGLRRTTGREVLRIVDSAAMLAIGNGIRLASGLAALPHTLHQDETPWHALPPSEALQQLASSEDGLTRAAWEARHRPPERPPGPVQRLAGAVGAELANPLTPVLAGGAAVSLATGSAADASMVGGVVALNAAIGGAQRLRAERALRFLRDSGTQMVTVRRDGAATRAPAEELVIGDVVELETGEPVPADARLLEARSLEVDESSLTGESLPVAKAADPVYADAVAERTSMLYQSSTLAAGEAVAIVVATGEDTEARRALAWTELDAKPTTGVEARLEQLTQLTIPLALLSGAGVAASGLLRNTRTQELLDASVGLAVAAVPEGLPLLANAAQRSAARRLSRHRVLVRNAEAVEALGRVDLLCADKTGTLTEGRLELRIVSDGEDVADVTEATEDHQRVLLAARRATPVDPEAERLPHPTDQAVATGTMDLGVERQDGGEFAILDDLPFAPDRSYHAVLAHTDEGPWLSVKGAPEEVLERSSHRLNGNGGGALSAAERERLTVHAEDLAARGLRVLAVAERPFSAQTVDDGEVADLGLVGLLGLRDPVRPVSAESVARLRAAGIDTIMITGDHPTTARSIAGELGLDDGILLTGPELDELDDEQLAETLPKVTVFARVSPLHKVRIVRTAQALGRVVAMTGDGANDAPAIQLADVGIAVGTRATEAARDSADVVILDDRLEVIVDAIAEGRGLWGSVREATAVLVGGNLGEISFTLLGSLVSRHPPLNTRQLLLVNLLTDVAPAMALAIRSPVASVEQLLAEGPDRSLGADLNRALVWRGAGAAAGATATYLAARPTGSLARARTAGLVALVGSQLGQTVARSGGDRRVTATGFGTFALMAGIIQTPGLSGSTGCRPLGPFGWAAGLGGAALGTAVGLLGPSAEERWSATPGGVSGALVDRLTRMAPRIPGLFEPLDPAAAVAEPREPAGANA